MEKRMLVFWSSVVNQTLERDHLKAGRIYRRRNLKSGEQRIAPEFRPQFLGNGESVIPDTINSAGRSRNDLEKRAQTETVCA
jgi:hypothetical protein